MEPETNPDFRSAMQHILLDRLFTLQTKFWKQELATIIAENAAHHGRRTGPFAINYLGKNWIAEDIEAQVKNPHFILPLHTDYPELEKNMLRVTAELAELEIEEYEADRFLAGLILFPAPPSIFKKILGGQLSNEIHNLLEVNSHETTTHLWDENTQAALTTYTHQHAYILKAMNERILLNLITQDQIAK